MFTDIQKRELDKKIKEATVRYHYAKLAQINIAELMTALRVAPSYKEMIPSQTDSSILVPNYINERDYFGKRPYLNKNAILLYIYLHFINPAASGQVRFSIKDAAAFMDLPQKTIRGNLKILLKHGYIRYIPDDMPGIYIVYIEGYAEKGSTARKGFKGYVTMSLESFMSLLKYKTATINELRIQLRGFLQCVPGPNKDRLNQISFKDFRKLLPSYVHMKDIKRILVTDQVTNFFHVKFLENDSYCMVKIKEKYDPNTIKKTILSDCDAEVRKLIKSMHRQNKYKSTSLSFTEKDYVDISKIALRLPVEDVLNGIKKLFDEYSNKSISSIGGLVRVLSLESFDNRLIMASQ